jgi:hypothetical protein
MVESINRNLAGQGEFYAGRERWVAAASELCSMVETRRNSIEFTENGLVFASDEDFDRFNELVSAADEVHRSEVAQMNERTSRIAQSMAMLGAATP